MPFMGETGANSDRQLNQKENMEISFQDLVKQLSDALGPSSGLDSEDVDPQHIQDIMKGYVSKLPEWQRYALGDPSRNYTRNLVDKGNGKSNLLILVWSAGKGSVVHDHANAHCVMKILKGSLKETLYSMPESNGAPVDGQRPLEKTREAVLRENEVTYISDKIGLHKISNASSDDVAVSLHLYTPPHAARFGFNVFDEETGKSSHINQATYYSCDGQKV